VTEDFAVNGVLRGEQLGGTLRLELVIALAQEGGSGDLSATRAGSILWRDTTRVELEGAGARFPIQMMDFERAGIAGGQYSAWMLVWSPDRVEAPVLGALRLLLNSGHPTIQRLVVEGSSKPELVAVQSALSHDLRRQLILGALSNQDFDRDEDYGEGTLGTVLQGVLDITFADQSLDSIRGFHERHPAEFETTLQAKSGLFWPDGA
jgi:hypothetical protein